MRTLLLACMLLLSAICRGQIITTFAGCNSTPCSAGNGVPATTANIGNAHYGKFDKSGNYYFSDVLGCKIRKIDTNGYLYTYAGSGLLGYSGDGIQATVAQFKYPEGIAFDKDDNLYIADHQNSRIRKVDKVTGIITTVAGSGVAGDAGDGGLATATSTKVFPIDVVFDKKGNLYISDNTYHKIRKIDLAGIITTFAGTGVAGFSGDGGMAISAKLNYPTSLAIDDTNNIYIVDGMNKRVRKIDTFGKITTVVGNGTGLYVGDGTPATSTQIGPLGICWHRGILYITDSNQRVRAVDKSGIIHTIAGTGIGGYNGDGIPALTAQLNSLGSITTDTCGNIIFMDILNVRIRKVALNPDCITMAVKEVTQGATTHTLSPNPATETVTISAGAAIERVSICNAMGQVVLQQQCTGSNTTATIAIRHLPAGIYVVMVNGLYAGKLLKED